MTLTRREEYAAQMHVNREVYVGLEWPCIGILMRKGTC
jgi:hypothetical protein